MQEPKELTVRADLADIDKVREFLRENFKDMSIAEEDALQIELSLHEICVNIALHAYPQQPGDLKVRIWLEEGTVFLEVRDRGVPFYPREKPTPNVEENLRVGKRGGLGIFLYRTMMDGFSYRREGPENVLKIFKKI